MSIKSAFKFVKKFIKHYVLYPQVLVYENRKFHKLIFRLLRKMTKGNSFSVIGENSLISIPSGTILKNCRLRISGKNNKILIGKNCRLENTTVDIYSEDSQIVVGENTFIGGNHLGFTHFLAKGFNTNIIIGKDCLFSYGIEARTTDSHSIFDNESGILLNAPKSIDIGDHCWIGSRSLILKGTNVGSGSIIGAGSVVTGSFEEGIIAAGIPAKKIKGGIKWHHKAPNLNATDLTTGTNVCQEV